MYRIQKKRKGLLFFVILFLCAFSVGLGVGYANIRNRIEEVEPEALREIEDIPRVRIPEEEEPGQAASAPLTEEPEKTEEPVVSISYWVEAVSGKVRVFTVDEAGVKRFSHTLPIEIESLREEDQKLFRTGFSLSSKEELLSFVEDFSS